MTICPRCKSEEYELNKSWDVVPKSGKGKAMRVTLYNCKGCGNKYRKGARLDLPTNTANEIGIKSTVASPANISPDVVADVPIKSEPMLTSESTLQTPNRMVATADVGETVHKPGLFERIKRAFSG